MDTNAYTDDDPLGLGWEYDNIHQDQIDWYKGKITDLSDYNKSILDVCDLHNHSYVHQKQIQSDCFQHYTERSHVR